MMRIKITILAMLCATGAHGMEEKHWSITLFGTKINVNKGNMLDAYAADSNKKVDRIVMGQYTQHKECESIPQNKGDNILKITDPYVSIAFSCRIFYERTNKYYKLFSKETFCSNKEIIDEALKDLRVCYQDVLTKVAQEKNGKSIALPTLGVERFDKSSPDAEYIHILLKDKYASAAIKSIFTFIKNNPEAYDRMELFVEQDFEFDVYKEHLQTYVEKLKRYRQLLEKYPDPVEK